MQIENDVENLQFYPVTLLTTGALEHQRTMQFTGVTPNNDISDIRGVSPRYIIKSRQADPSKRTYVNSITSASDSYPRREMKFYVNLKNILF